MSTYYYFICKRCEVKGGFLSQQMWGTGNFDIIESFKFLGRHLACVGRDEPGNVCLVSERDNESLWKTERKDKFLKHTEDIFPFSDDWVTVTKRKSVGAIKEDWARHFMNGWKFDEEAEKALIRDTDFESE